MLNLPFPEYMEFHFARLRAKSPDTKYAVLITQVRRMDRTQNGCQYAGYDSLGLAVPALEGAQV
jgi:hypothetical protein